jgi:hypothetical protein
MATLTIRKLDDSVKTKLRIRAAENGRSMEEEVRANPGRSSGTGASISRSGQPHNFFESIRRDLAEAGIDGVELEIPPSRTRTRATLISAAPNTEPMNSR